ncbi:hypothetical protein BBO99_00003594 [Phytophthora kernoviae]|uniref:Uncharacterized protein n=2 Tax=Phytophthora kernoviae TaxID=325452 RepID=A0A3R7JX24_9STRA|nr:hypothetical protein G195_005942 [Phytophthora kernoviae 00238/432]KAG2523657.1 hypothetical protein JM16_003292 [Phytophthora kernoviae]KAG2529090.1 hypothetical protein JM18_002939 [Phytophthora kernoviae]RLN27332.1 hypothetical protein BBI17_003733 [Phytophthora kernoviae]RLN81570.1 hypothetical protein BBO99_00003594 [Phytophthora kernoviae]
MEVSFKKKAKRASAGRKRSRRPREDQEEDDVVKIESETPEEDEAERIQRSIEEVREDQRQRTQLLREELANQKQEASKQKQKSSQPSKTQQYGLHDPKKDGAANKKLLTLLDGQFTGTSATSEKDQHEELMNQFIEERLQKKRKTEDQEVESNNSLGATAKSAEDALFELPAHLNPDVPKSSAAYDDGESGGMLMGSAGIAEVELPSSYAERTERATLQALEASHLGASKHNAIGGLSSSALPANFSTDFNRHRSDYVTELKNLNKDEQRERGFRKVGKNQASDDRAVSRFRKFESRKLRR